MISQISWGVFLVPGNSRLRGKGNPEWNRNIREGLLTRRTPEFPLRNYLDGDGGQVPQEEGIACAKAGSRHGAWGWNRKCLWRCEGGGIEDRSQMQC